MLLAFAPKSRMLRYYDYGKPIWHPLKIPVGLALTKWSETITAEDPVKEERIVKKFLVAEGEKAASVHKRLQNVYKDQCLKKRTVFKWVERFNTSVTETNIERVDRLIRPDRCISVDELEHEFGMSRPSILEIVHERLGY